MGIAWMDKLHMWLPQKIAPCLAKFVGQWPRQTPLTTGGLLTPGHKLPNPVTLGR